MVDSFVHINARGVKYYLHSKQVTLKNTGKEVTIYFFSKESDGALGEMPSGYQVIENNRSGLPFLKKEEE